MKIGQAEAVLVVAARKVAAAGAVTEVVTVIVRDVAANVVGVTEAAIEVRAALVTVGPKARPKSILKS